MSIPLKPTVFTADRAPDWCELKMDAFKTQAGATWWSTRSIITPRLQLVHTNGATREGSIESAINWGNAAPYANTHPHYQVDRSRAAKLVPTDRKGIGNKTVTEYRGEFGDVADWSIVIETADAGYPTPGEDGGFIGDQIEMIAQILAYESILHAIPLWAPAVWHGSGTASHTDPFGYPYWTNANGKVCPGRTKKQQMRNLVLPRAREVADAWTYTPAPTPVPTPIPPGDLPMTFLWKPAGFKNVFLVDSGGAVHCSPELLDHAKKLLVPTVADTGHAQMLKSVLTLSGCTLADLVKE